VYDRNLQYGSVYPSLSLLPPNFLPPVRCLSASKPPASMALIGPFARLFFPLTLPRHRQERLYVRKSLPSTCTLFRQRLAADFFLSDFARRMSPRPWFCSFTKELDDQSPFLLPDTSVVIALPSQMQKAPYPVSPSSPSSFGCRPPGPLIVLRTIKDDT